MDMFVKVEYTGTMSVIDLAKLCGVAPCQILSVNKCTEQELVGRVINLPVSTPAMVRKLPWFYKVGEEGRLTVTTTNDILSI